MIPVFLGKVRTTGRMREAALLAKRANRPVTFSDCIDLERPEALPRWIWSLAGCEVEIVVRKKSTKRSDRQNRWWWQTVDLIAKECGCRGRTEKEQLHYALVFECFGTRHDEVTGLTVPKVSSSNLSTQEFSELMDWVVQWAAEKLNMVLMLPSEGDWSPKAAPKETS